MSVSNNNAEKQWHPETWVSESIIEHPDRDARGTLRDSSREKNLHISAHAFPPEEYDSREKLLTRLKSLERENHELKNGSAEETSRPVPPPAPPVPPVPPVPHYTWRTFHCIASDIYLESPQWKEGERGPVLQASSPLQNDSFYLEQHPEIAFVFYKDYEKSPPADNSRIMSKDGIFRIPQPSKQTLLLTSEHMISAVEQLGENIPNFANFFPDFNPYTEIPAPSMFIYHSLPLLHYVKPHLTPLEHGLLEQLTNSVIASHGKEYIAAKRLAAKGIVSRRLLKYLVRPGDVLVRTQDPVPCAYVATTWAKEESSHREYPSSPQQKRSHKLNAEKNQGPRKRKYRYEVAVWSWAFDGSFERKRDTINIELTVGDEDDEVRITYLNHFPLRFDKGGLQELLEERGRTFWKCRTKHLVSYSDEDDGFLSSVSTRRELESG